MSLSPFNNCSCPSAAIFQGHNCFRSKYLDFTFTFDMYLRTSWIETTPAQESIEILKILNAMDRPIVYWHLTQVSCVSFFIFIKISYWFITIHHIVNHNPIFDEGKKRKKRQAVEEDCQFAADKGVKLQFAWYQHWRLIATALSIVIVFISDKL